MVGNAEKNKRRSEGVPVSELKVLIAYWRGGFDWRAQESRLNRLPQYVCTLDCGQEIHFIHKKGRGSTCRPLLMIHDWPGLFTEMEAILPLLTDPAAHGAGELDAFEVVVPSLPGYGFSPAPRNSGTGLYEIAGMFAELMEKLGYDSFCAQGGDWGAHITSWLAHRFPERVQAIHLNFLPGSYSPYTGSDAPLSPAGQAFLDRQQAWYKQEGGYNLIQATLACRLNDSPAGLAAWIYEKLYFWSDWKRSYDGTLISCSYCVTFHMAHLVLHRIPRP
uniref:epoxide hydrolase family protein n=1 Tax=Citrobacter freundii TaxID=546 RepID=UPI0035CB5D0C